MRWHGVPWRAISGLVNLALELLFPVEVVRGGSVGHCLPAAVSRNLQPVLPHGCSCVEARLVVQLPSAERLVEAVGTLPPSAQLCESWKRLVFWLGVVMIGVLLLPLLYLLGQKKCVGRGLFSGVGSGVSRRVPVDGFYL